MGFYPFPHTPDVVPGSDGAGIVEDIGKGVTRFKKGEKVLTLFNQGHITGHLDPQSIGTGLGGAIHGVFRQYGAYDEQGLVRMPANLNFIEGSTLSCAALTAWNGLSGLDGRRLLPGDWVLTQGTGGISLFALQFAKATGAKAVATTSSDSKAAKLKEMGADHVINYKAEPNWGEKAKSLTTAGRGFQHVIEVGGPTSIKQSLNAVDFGGLITIIGFLGGYQAESQPSFMDVMGSTCVVRGVVVGSRTQFEEMN